jgi:hypothetical protein
MLQGSVREADGRANSVNRFAVGSLDHAANAVILPVPVINENHSV